MSRSNAVWRAVQRRRSSIAGCAGIAAIAVAVLLTLGHVAGDVVPTVLAIAGVGSLMAGVCTGAMQVVDNFRIRRDEPLDGPDEDEDE